MPTKTRDQSAILPANVAVCFVPLWNDDGPVSTSMPAPYIVTVPIATVIAAAATGTGAPTGLTGMASATKIFHSTAQALFTNASPTTATNATNLTNLANQIAQDYYAWRLIAYDRVIAGIVGHVQDGFCEVEWSYLPPELGGARTRAYARPGNDEPEELIHSDAPPWVPTLQKYEVISTTAFAAAPSGDQLAAGTVQVRKSSYAGALTTTSSPTLTFTAWNKDTSSTIASGVNLEVSRDDFNGKYTVSWKQC